jgi:hypothetical protein
MNAGRSFPNCSDPHAFHRSKFSTILMIVALIACARAASAQDTANLPTQPGKKPVDLQPTTQLVPNAKLPTIDLGGWSYHTLRNPSPRDSVPWQLIVTPTDPLPPDWKKNINLDAATLGPIGNRGGDVRVGPQAALNSPIPIVEVPEILWKQWMAADLQDVVGIHFHEVVSDDVARILFTLHKIPPDEPQSATTPPEPTQPTEPPPVRRTVPLNPPSATSAPARPPEPRGVRIEATLLAPVTYCLDQTIVVRADKEKPKTESRALHEYGHAEVSQQMFFSVLAGPQDWNPQYCTGRRSRIEYYWHREKIGRFWDGYRGSKGEVVTLRTTVVLVPPTRWSTMLPIPAERVTAKQLQDFNDAIVRVSQMFVIIDAEAQKKFHATHGEYERGP